jgi:membrane protein required for colicin V production
MNGLDVIVIAVILLSGLFAFARGFVKEALSVAAWIGAAFAALYGLPYVAPLAERFLTKGPVADAAAGFTVFLVALVILSVLTSFVASHVKRSGLSGVDRTLGLVFGLMRGLVLVCLAYIVLSWAVPATGQPPPTWIAQAKTLPLLANGAERLRRLVPASYLERAGSKVNEARRASEQMKEAAGAMGALSTPRQSPPSTREPGAAYTPDARHDLDRLIEQQQDRH